MHKIHITPGFYTLYDYVFLRVRIASSFIKVTTAITRTSLITLMAVSHELIVID